MPLKFAKKKKDESLRNSQFHFRDVLSWTNGRLAIAFDEAMLFNGLSGVKTNFLQGFTRTGSSRESTPPTLRVTPGRLLLNQTHIKSPKELVPFFNALGLLT